MDERSVFESERTVKFRDLPPHHLLNVARPQRLSFPMLGNLGGLVGQPQPPAHQQQGQQQQQQPPQNQNMQQPPPPPPPLNGQDLNLSNILHFLQSEWRRYERERNEWEIERAEMRARIALLEGERRSFENTRNDLLRRIKMLEFALRMERSKQLNQPAGQSTLPSKIATLQNQSNPSSNKDETGSHKGGSSGSSPRSEDVPLPSENRMSIGSLAGIPNGVSAGAGNKSNTWAGANWTGMANANTSAALGKPAPGRDPKSRAKSREYLKQCLQEISYLTSPQAMNPLPNRSLLTQPALPLTIPNVPPLDQMAFIGRPRKVVPEVGKDNYPLNGMSLMSGPMTAPAGTGPQGPLLDRENRMNTGSSVQLHPSNSQQSQQHQGGPSGGIFQLQQQQQQQQLSQQSLMNQGQPLQLQTQQLSKEGQERPEGSESQLTAIFRPDNDFRERLERARSEKSGHQQQIPLGVSAWESSAKEDDEDGKDEEPEIEDDDAASTSSEDDGKIWRARRTLRNHLDAVRALAFHPTEMCLATGGDDCTVKIWRMDMVGLASPAIRTATDIEPQLTLRGHTGSVTSLVHSPGKRVLYSASLDSSIRVWSLPPASHTTYAPYDSSRIRGDLVGHTDAVWGLALIRDETLLISCGAEGAVKVWDVSATSGIGPLKLTWGYNGLDGEEDEEVIEQAEKPGATCLEAIKSDLRQVAVAFTNSVIKIFDIDTGKQVLRLQPESSSDGAPLQVNSIASHPTMPILVTGHEDKHIRIWDISTGQCTHSMVTHLDSVTSLSIDAAGFSLVSGSHDCSVRFWDLLGSRSCIQEISSHREKAHEGVLAVEFHPSVPVMASAGADGVVKLYASS